MRSIWTGSISFGLINIPVKVYSASEDRALKFRLLDKHGHCPISYAKVCRSTNREIPYEDIVKGYEYQKGDFVVLTDEDFQKAAPKKTKTIEVRGFVDEMEIPAKFFDKPYYLEPDPKAQKAYVLLREALKRSKKVAVATWVLKDKEHTAMIRTEGRALMLIQLRYQDEIRDPTDLHLPESANFSKRELELAVSLIEQLENHWNAKEYKDTYTEQLKKVIARKAKGKPIKVAKETEPVPTDMRDLMRALRESIEQEQRGKSRERDAITA
jgi:DNA end-binding protein Ku